VSAGQLYTQFQGKCWDLPHLTDQNWGAGRWTKLPRVTAGKWELRRSPAQNCNWSARPQAQLQGFHMSVGLTQAHKYWWRAEKGDF
jgi:hypothetical protein